VPRRSSGRQKKAEDIGLREQNQPLAWSSRSKALSCERLGALGFVFFFCPLKFLTGQGCNWELIEGFRKPVAFLLAPGGSCRLWQTPPCPAYGDALNRVNRRLEYIACDGKTVIQKTLRSWSAFFPPTAENAFEKQHLKHVRKETVCLSECDFLGSRIYP